MRLNQNNSASTFDSEGVRRDAAWYSAGVGAFGAYSFVATFVTGAAVGLVAAIFHLSPDDVLFGVLGVQLATNAAIGTYLAFRSREIARTQIVQVDRF